METNEIFRGRLIDHLQFVVEDLAKTKAFYSAVFKVLNIPLIEGEGFFYCDELFVSEKDSPAAVGKLTGRTHLAFQAKDEAMVNAFYEAGLKAGGQDNGKPGLRPYHPGYYGAFLIDPDGNNIEAVYHGPAKRSAEYVKFTWS